MYYELADAASSGTGAVWAWFTGSSQSFCRDDLNRTMSREGRQGYKKGGKKGGRNNEKEPEKI